MDQDAADINLAIEQSGDRLPTSVQAVVFDLDGTLLDTEASYRAAFMAALAGFDGQIDASVYDSLVGLPAPARRLLLPAILGDGLDADTFLAAYYAQRATHLAAGPQLKPGAHQLLRHLTLLGMPIAIATSASAATAAQHLASSGLASRFRVVVSRDDVHRGKPSPDSFILAAARLGVPPQACLAIEDSPHGVAAAHAAGMMVVMVPDALPPTPETIRLCVRVAASLHDVAALLPACREPARDKDRSRWRV